MKYNQPMKIFRTNCWAVVMITNVCNRQDGGWRKVWNACHLETKMLKYDFSGVLFGEILDVSRVTRWQRGFTTVGFCVGILNDLLDPTPFPGLRLQPVHTSFRSSSKNAVIGGISSLKLCIWQQFNFLACQLWQLLLYFIVTVCLARWHSTLYL